MNITRDQFRLQLDRLIDVWGEKPFSSQREAMIWEIVENHEYPVVISVVDRFIRELNRAPLPKDFSEVLQSLSPKKKLALGDHWPKEIAHCKDCLDSGFVRLVRNEIYDSWAIWEKGSAPCYCSRGAQAVAAAKRKTHDLGRQFNETWKSSYSIKLT